MPETPVKRVARRSRPGIRCRPLVTGPAFAMAGYAHRTRHHCSLLAVPAASSAPPGLAEFSVRAPTANAAAESDVETVWNRLEVPITLHNVDALVETADELHMQVDYHIALGHVTIATRMDQDGTAWRHVNDGGEKRCLTGHAPGLFRTACDSRRICRPPTDRTRACATCSLLPCPGRSARGPRIRAG
jgi:hypothetical protein